MIRYISRRVEREGEEGSYEGHLSFVEGPQKQTCDVSEKKSKTPSRSSKTQKKKTGKDLS
jgi:hypothetical protein